MESATAKSVSYPSMDASIQSAEPAPNTTPISVVKPSAGQSIRGCRTFLHDSRLVTVMVLAIVFHLIERKSIHLHAHTMNDLCKTSCLFPASVALPTIAAQSDVITSFSGAWTLSSPTYTRLVDLEPRKFYYEAINMDISVTGSYSFIGNSMIQMEFRLYDGNFDPTAPNRDLVVVGAKSYGEEPLRMTATLLTAQRYVLIVMAQAAGTLGSFSLVVSGSATVPLRTSRSKSMNWIVSAL